MIGRYGLTKPEVEAAVWLVEPRGRRLHGADAVAEAFVRLGGGWGAAGRLLRLPPVRWLAGPSYRFAAAHRRALSRWWSERPPCDRPGVDCV